jgi:hypothetical protein
MPAESVNAHCGGQSDTGACSIFRVPKIFYKVPYQHNTRWFKYDQDYLCVNKSQFVPVIFEPPCIYHSARFEFLQWRSEHSSLLSSDAVSLSEFLCDVSKDRSVLNFRSQKVSLENEDTPILPNVGKNAADDTYPGTLELSIINMFVLFILLLLFETRKLILTRNGKRHISV